MKDFFIRYNRADRSWAEWIAWHLDEVGYTTILQAWDFRPGSNFVLEMQHAATEAERTIAVLSPEYLASLFTQPEWAAAFAKDPTGDRGILVPVRVKQCDLHGMLSQIITIELVGLAEDAAKEELLGGVLRGRAKPTEKPGFPGSAQQTGRPRPDFPSASSSDGPDTESLATRAREVALKNLAQWKKWYGYDPDRSIQLTFSLEPDNPANKGKIITLNEVCQIAYRVRGLVLKGSPGAGKTTTLLQIASEFADDPDGSIPILISLPDWAWKEQDILGFIAKEPLYQAVGLSETDWVRLNNAGRLIFLLNGWNEISEKAVESALPYLRGMVRNSPATAFVIATRETAIKPPLMKPVIVHVEPLDPLQRRAIIEASGLSNPAATIDIIERHSVLRQITRTPLFLTGVIELARRDTTIPISRYGIIGELIGIAETDPDHEAEIGTSPSRGFHRDYLSQLASAMCSTGGTHLGEGEAREEIAKRSKVLQEKGLVGGLPDAPGLLDSLASHHLLVRATYAGRTSVRFVHQQFQEWFAAEWLYERLRGVSESPTNNGTFRFQCDILNYPVWEESLKFLAERLNPTNGMEIDSNHGDELIRLIMPVDLIFAAQLARLVGWGTLSNGRMELSSALRAWYARPGEPHKQCALSGMLATGSADFQDIFGPLMESDDQQVRLGFYLAWKPFPLSCLGDQWSQRVAGWSEERRAEFIREMWWHADASHHQLAVRFAQEDPSSLVQAAALETLAWSGALESLMAILERDTYIWPTEGSYGFLEVLPKRYLARLAPRIKTILPTLSAPDARCTLLRLLDEASDQNAIMLMKKELEGDPPSRTMSELLPRIHVREPQWVAEWLGERMFQGTFWEEQWAEYLSGASTELLTSLGAAASDRELDLNTLAQRIRAFSKAAPHLAARTLLPEFLEERSERLRSRTFQDGWSREDVLHSTLRDLPYPALVHAAFEIEHRLIDSSNVEAILDVLSPSAPFEQDLRSILGPEDRDRLRELIITWGLYVAPPEHNRGGRRASLANLLGAIGKPEDAAILDRWIQDESVRNQEPHSRVNWTSWYAGTLAKLHCDGAAVVLLRLLSDSEYLGSASHALLQMVREDERTPRTQVSFGPDYRGVWLTRYERETVRRRREDESRKVQYSRSIHSALAARLDESQKPLEASIFPSYGVGEAAIALSHLGEEDCIPVILRSGVWGALEVLVLKGIKLPGAEVLTVVDPIIAKVETEPWYSGRNNWYVVARCLSILLFSDNPALGVERIRRLPSEIFLDRVKNLIWVLGLCHAPEAAEFLAELFGNHDVLRHCMWEYSNALAESGQPQGWRTLLRLLDELGENPNRGGSDRFHTMRGLGEALSRVATEDSEMWSEIKSRCEGSLNGGQREVLVWMLEKLDTEAGALIACLLLRDEPGFRIEQLGVWMIEHALFYRVEAGTTNSYYLQPKAANAFRKCLMDQALHDPTRQKSSLALLAEIETRRLESGKPPKEPRHPDIDALTEMNAPWPLI